ncbi:MAG: sulfite exporter TauE/SafE family protein [Planctomycetes bacterium]|nr:sulfite exporter TauE/SafE family protein [Planctomycetota bacterium]
MLYTAVSGLLLGAVHVFSGPDHLAALAPLAVRARRRAWAVGLRWGLGHSSGVILVGALAFLARGFIDIDALSEWGEHLVGVILIGVGLWGLRSLSKSGLHAHPHSDSAEGEAHTHFHVHAPGEEHESPEAHVHTHAAFMVGTFHGVAGTSHLLGVLPALALPTTEATALYLLAFAVGTVFAMVAFSSALGWSAPEPGMKSYGWLLGGTSGAAIAVGLGWILLPIFGVELP